MRNAILFGTFTLIFLCLACQAKDAGPLETKSVLPTPVSFSVVASPTPASTDTPTPLPTPTATFSSLLPPGSEPQLDLAWSVRSGCGQKITLLPYRLSDGQFSLAAIQHKPGHDLLFWDWSQTKRPPAYWREIRPEINNPLLQNGFTFLGLDQQGKWQLSYITDLCHQPTVAGILPIAHPERIFFAGSRFRLGYSEHWLIDGDSLKVYRWVDQQATAFWSLDDLPGDGFIVRNFDLIGDERPEVVLTWWSGSKHTNWREQIKIHQMLQLTTNGYRLMGEITPDMQMIDLDGDKEQEFLKPLPASSPQQWQVYQWQGDRFDWREPLSRPTGPSPQELSITNLPAISLDFFFTTTEGIWRWPKQGGTLQAVPALPELPPANACSRTLTAYEVVSWSPGCNYALVSIHSYIEGGSYAVLKLTNDALIEIPNSFVYVSGYSSFAWDRQEQFIIHARADGPAGLFQIDLNSGLTRQLFPVGSISSPLGFDFPGRGAVAPQMLTDGSLIFTVQAPTDTPLYPPLGVYRLTETGQIKLLTEIPPLMDRPISADSTTAISYGELSVSPDGSMFLYQAPSAKPEDPSYGVLILGLTAGSASWNLSSVADGQNFRWANE